MTSNCTHAKVEAASQRVHGPLEAAELDVRRYHGLVGTRCGTSAAEFVSPRSAGEGAREVKTGAAWLVLALWVCGVAGCRHEAPVSNGWIHGDSGQRWQAVGKHLRGLDVAMVEIGYRYQELYWAGVDSNWDYADYQQSKIKLSLKNALERRPKRRSSAEQLFLPVLDAMNQAVATRERAAFDEAFGALTASCNSCHAAEGVASFYVERPADRQSAIRAPR